MSTSTASPTRTRIQGWSLAGAWVLGLIGISQLIAWGNRWYAASMFARSADDEGEWEFAYSILNGAHQALTAGLALLALAAVLAWFSGRGQAPAPPT